jgi:hypothetical protein
MRSTWTLALLSAGFLFAACGGGGGGGSSGSSVAGTIRSRDGSTSSLAGVVLGCTETGSTDVSDVAGQFALEIPTGTRFHLEVTDPEAVEGHESGGDCHETDDDTPDETDLKGAEVEIGEVEDGEHCEIEIEIEDGEIVGISVHKGDGEHEGDDDEVGEAALLPPGGDKADGYGEIEIARRGDTCVRIEVEAEGLPAGVYDVYLVGPDGGEALIGHLAFGEKDEAHVVFEACGDGLPLGAGTPEALAGLRVDVRDAVGNVLLQGIIPPVGVEDEKDGDEPDGEWHDGDGGVEGGTKD